MLDLICAKPISSDLCKLLLNLDFQYGVLQEQSESHFGKGIFVGRVWLDKYFCSNTVWEVPARSQFKFH